MSEINVKAVHEVYKNGGYITQREFAALMENLGDSDSPDYWDSDRIIPEVQK